MPPPSSVCTLSRSPSASEPARKEASVPVPAEVSITGPTPSLGTAAMVQSPAGIQAAAEATAHHVKRKGSPLRASRSSTRHAPRRQQQLDFADWKKRGGTRAASTAGRLRKIG